MRSVTLISMLSLSLSLSLIPTHTLCMEQCQSFRDFNSVLVFPMFGYKSKEELYHDCSAYHRVDDLCIPIIAFNSADDPFCPPHGEHTSWENQ